MLIYVKLYGNKLKIVRFPNFIFYTFDFTNNRLKKWFSHETFFANQVISSLDEKL